MPRPCLAFEPLEDRATPTTLPPGFTESLVAGGLTGPTAAALAPDGRLLVTEQDGALRVVQNDTLLPAPALSLTVDSAGERGLLGVAVSPNFAANGFVYLYYTVPAGGGSAAFNRVSRFTLGGNTIDPTSGVVLVNLDPLSAATNHNGGGLAFGPDGKLYVGVGENANATNAQSISTRFGKILRYNPDGSIPADNPTAFAGLTGTPTGANRAIWAVGLRNPFTLAIQPGTGRVFANDVGQNAFEEVDEVAAGKNYGWPATEGDFDPAAFPTFTRPLVSYAHGAGTDKGFAVTGAAFYNPATATFPAEYAGDYFFGDLANSWVRRYDPATGANVLFASDLTTGGLVDLDVTPQGDLVYLARGSGGAGQGAVYRVRADPPPPPPPGPPVPPRAVAVGGGADRPPAVRVFTPENGQRDREFGLGTVTLFPPFTGEVRTASADVTGDGVPDVIAGAGPGSRPYVVVFDGATGGVVTTPQVFEGTFTGGVYVAAGDIDGDGVADVIVSPDQGGGPRVRVFRGARPDVVLADFFGIDDPTFRGGARVAAGDVTGDGRADLIVAAGFGGGPRVAAFDGATVGSGDRRKLFGDFFAFEDSLRNGVFVAAGDVTGDGRADLVAGAGPGGGPRVRVLGGTELLTDRQSPLANFFAGDAAARGGVRVAARELDGDGKADLIVGTAPGVPARVVVYRGADLTPAGTPPVFRTLVPFEDGYAGGVYVG